MNTTTLIVAGFAALGGYGLGLRRGHAEGADRVTRAVSRVIFRWGKRNPLDARELGRQITAEIEAAHE